MERLRERESNGEPWSLQSDKDLLKALQDLSGDIMASIQRLEKGISGLELDAAKLSTGVSNCSAAFRELSHSKFIEQDVTTEAEEEDRPTARRNAAITAENFSEIVHPKYREALQLASAAFKEHAESNPGRLPHIFGSPEYLQDAGFGVGGAGAGGSIQQQAEEVSTETKDEAESTVNGAQQDGEAASVLDFKSLLEAALRGDLDASEADALLNAGPASELDDAASTAKHDERIDISSQAKNMVESLPADADSLALEDTEGVPSADASAPAELDVSLEELLEGEEELFTEEELRT